jgi:hypothetical protein
MPDTTERSSSRPPTIDRRRLLTLGTAVLGAGAAAVAAGGPAWAATPGAHGDRPDVGDLAELYRLAPEVLHDRVPPLDDAAEGAWHAGHAENGVLGVGGGDAFLVLVGQRPQQLLHEFDGCVRSHGPPPVRVGGRHAGW